MTDVRRMPIHEMPNEEKDRIQSLVEAGHIPGISVATVSSDGKVEATALGLANTQSETKVNSDTQFWACSLSKPVFAYLVIKLIEDGTLPPFFLDEKISHNGKEVTPRMMLSHQTGLPNEEDPNNPDPIFGDSKPGEIFRYSGEGYLLLQKIIKDRTGEELNDLAIKKVFEPLGMTRTSFLFPEGEVNLAQPHTDDMSPNPQTKKPSNNNNAAASLYTTASDYARFLLACMKSLNFIEIITPQIEDMKNDIDSKGKVNSETLKPINWGLGFGLQKDEKGQVVSAFHWGHGPGARTFFSVNLKDNSAVVYLTNSENGMAIAEEIAEPSVGDISPTMKFLSEKYGYRQINSPGWEEYHERLMMGLAEEKEGHYDQAISSYQEALKLRPDKKRELDYRIMWVDAQKAQKHPEETSINLENVSGQYGPLRIFVADSKLQIAVGDPNGPHSLKIIDNNTLLDGNVIIKITRDNDNKPVSLTCYFPDRPPFVTNAPPSTNELKVNTAEEKKSSLSGTAHTATLLGVSPSDMATTPEVLIEPDAKAKLPGQSVSPSRKMKDVDIPDKEMDKSSFGRGSNTARKFGQ